MNNKKIKNATKTVSSGIQFKSEIEARLYKVLTTEGFNPKYEEKTFILSNRIRPSVAFFNRIGKEFKLDSRPIQPITYTPDFTFEYNGILIIIEVKGFENDVFYLKKNLFRKHLETLNTPSMFFEIRNKRELLEAIQIIKEETPQTQKIRNLIPFLPEKEISSIAKLLSLKDWKAMRALVDKLASKMKENAVITLLQLALNDVT